MIYWFTGQPGHGKTVLGSKLAELLKYANIDNIIRIDGDDLRAIMNNQDYSKEGRLRNVKLAQDIALFLHNKGFNVIVSLVSPYRAQREEYKHQLGNNIKEFYVHTTEHRGKEQYHVSDYEAPLENYISIDTTEDTPAESIQKILY